MLVSLGKTAISFYDVHTLFWSMYGAKSYNLQSLNGSTCWRVFWQLTSFLMSFLTNFFDKYWWIFWPIIFIASFRIRVPWILSWLSLTFEETYDFYLHLFSYLWLGVLKTSAYKLYHIAPAQCSPGQTDYRFVSCLFCWSR